MSTRRCVERPRRTGVHNVADLVIIGGTAAFLAAVLAGIPAWWLMPLAAMGSTAISLRRAAGRAR
jgi:hypothetical protein